MKKTIALLIILCLAWLYIPLAAGSRAEAGSLDISDPDYESYDGECLIVRNETVRTEDSVGSIEYVVQEGAPVSQGEVICHVYSSGVSAREMAALQDYRREITEYQMKLLSTETEADPRLEKLDADLLINAREIRAIIHGARGNLNWRESQLKEAANTRQGYLREKYAGNARMGRLYDEESMQAMKISSWEKQITAKEPGIVSFYTDGYESLTMDDMDLYTPDEVRNMINGTRPVSYTRSIPVFRVVQNSGWAVLMVNRNDGWAPEPGAVYELKLDGVPDPVPAKVARSVRSGGELLVHLEIDGASVLPVLYIRTCKGRITGGSMPGEIPGNSQTVPGGRNDLHELPCRPDQGAVPFMDGILYRDGTNLCHASGTGEPRWVLPVETDVQFEVGPAHAAVWNGSGLTLMDRNGNAVYRDTPEGEIQFVRIGKQYMAIVTGDDTAPRLSVRDLQGAQVDAESEAFSGKMLLDAGFFGDGDQYLWTLSLDLFSMVPNTVLNTFQVAKMNYSQASLGGNTAYRILYENGKLRLFTAQQLLSYDYKCIWDTTDTVLLYGWQLIGQEIPDRGRSGFLLAPAGQVSVVPAISELRILEGDQDRRYMLPETCVGACMSGGYAYAVSGTDLYIIVTESGKRFRYPISGLGTETITALNGVTSDGMMIVTTSADKMYSLALPR